MILFRILIFLSIVAASVGSAIAKENEPFLPAKNTETTSVGLVATKEKESFLPVPVTVKNAETKTKRGRRRTTMNNIEANKAGKASPPNSDEVVLKRKRERKCSTALFEGKFVYRNGCDGDPWEVTITCDKKGRGEERDSGLMCNYYEENLNEDLDKCAYSGDFVSKEALSTDGQGNCELGPFSIHPVATVDDEDCKGNYPELDVKIIAVNKDELRIYFSRDGGKTYYNEDDPRLAIRIPEHDADGMNSGGSSSKGGKKGTNDRRRLVEAAKAQLQRKLQCEKKCFGDKAELEDAVNYYIGLGCQYWWNKALCEQIFVQEPYNYGYPMNNWCVDHVTDMSWLFWNKHQFNEDISNWKTGKVTNMHGMFYGAHEFNRDLSRWDVSKVTNMDAMFYLAKKFNQDISSWDVSQVQYMPGMFANAPAFNQDISSWDISQVTRMDGMLWGASSFNRDLCKWADKFPYDWASNVFRDTKCDYQSDPEKENGGPFCASDCKS